MKKFLTRFIAILLMAAMLSGLLLGATASDTGVAEDGAIDYEVFAAGGNEVQRTLR